MKIKYSLRYTDDGGESFQTMEGVLRGRSEPRMKTAADQRRLLRRIHDFDFDAVQFDYVQVSWPRVETPTR